MSSGTITVVDSGGANLSSVLFALDRLGLKSELTTDAGKIRAAERVVLPGVGAAGAVMRNLADRGLIGCLRELKQPVLGICLGMQILFERSEEGDVECLGVIPGTVRELPGRAGFPVPHMGWNRVTGDSPLLARSEEYFYFVHSFAAPLGDCVTGVADYGGAVPAVVQRGNYMGVQFHPERSGVAGAQLLKRFAELRA